MADKFVIDTNVAISANGKDTHASFSCQLACIKLLENCKKLPLVIDESDFIMGEYARHLSYAGQPGIGDMFFKYLHDNQYAAKKIYAVKITQSKDARRGFDELPVNSLDPSDRKFLAAAVVAKAIIVNATDSDWIEQSVLLQTLKVGIKQLCPEHSCK